MTGEVIPYCALCNKTSYLMKCSRCKLTYYCSSECQKKDWKSHKQTCGSQSLSLSTPTAIDSNTSVLHHLEQRISHVISLDLQLPKLNPSSVVVDPKVMLTIKSAPDRGKFVQTQYCIPAGTRLVAEKPLLSWCSETDPYDIKSICTSVFRASDLRIKRLIDPCCQEIDVTLYPDIPFEHAGVYCADTWPFYGIYAFASASADVQEKVLALHYPERDDVDPAVWWNFVKVIEKMELPIGITKTIARNVAFIALANCYSIGANDDTSALFELSSRFCHSCNPNACYTTINNEFHLRSIREINCFEEVTVSYLRTELLYPTVIRRQELYLGKFFICKCDRCESLEQSRSFRCPNCNVGVILPRISPEWICNRCSQVISGKEKLLIMNYEWKCFQKFKIIERQLEETLNPCLILDFQKDLSARLHDHHWLLGACVSGLVHEYCRSSEQYSHAAYYLCDVISFAFSSFSHHIQLLTVADIGWLYFYLADAIMGMIDATLCSTHIEIPESCRIVKMFPMEPIAIEKKKLLENAITFFRISLVIIDGIFGRESSFYGEVAQSLQHAEEYLVKNSLLGS